jgi:hypothetical protein
MKDILHDPKLSIQEILDKYTKPYRHPDHVWIANIFDLFNPIEIIDMGNSIKISTGINIILDADNILELAKKISELEERIVDLEKLNRK